MPKDKMSNSMSLLSKNVKLEGEIRGEENLHVDGYIKGAIKLNGNIFIGNTGIIEADVEANTVVIQGQVKGNVLARKQLEIRPSGQLIGDCSARSIDIKEGAVFEGRSIMLKSSSAAEAPGISASTPNHPAAQDKQN